MKKSHNAKIATIKAQNRSNTHKKKIYIYIYVQCLGIQCSHNMV